MPQRYITTNVFDEAIQRMFLLYEAGHRVVVSMSGGKDSGVCLEICLIAAKLSNRLPVEVAMRDEEIMFPGTFEYCERLVARPEIVFDWAVAGQPIINIFNRAAPYFWAFDDRLKPEQWVRTPPEYAVTIPEMNIQGLINSRRYPPPEGKDLIAVIGLRATESINRRMGIFSSRGYLTGKDSWGIRKARPIYDWKDGDVWKAISDNKWDYNSAYDVMNRLGISRSMLRIAPPTLSAAGISTLGLASRAFPRWFDKVCERLEGVRTAAMFGRRAVEPMRKMGETWEQTYRRECIDEAPDWIAERCIKIAEHCLTFHSRHSGEEGDFPQNTQCPKCKALSSWRQLCKVGYMGDPFSLKQQILPYIEPEFFRKGAGTWGGGKPTW